MIEYLRIYGRWPIQGESVLMIEWLKYQVKSYKINKPFLYILLGFEYQQRITVRWMINAFNLYICLNLEFSVENISLFSTMDTEL